MVLFYSSASRLNFLFNVKWQQRTGKEGRAINLIVLNFLRNAFVKIGQFLTDIL